MKKLLIICIFLLGACSKNVMVKENSQTLENWRVALEMRNAQRYELAYQYYSLALSSASTQNAIIQLKKEMEDTQRAIKSMR